MKRLSLLSALIFISISAFSQESIPLYKGLYYNMSLDQAKKEFKNHGEEYKNISFGDGVVWRLFKQNFHVVNDELKGLVLTPQGYGFGMSHENAKVYLTNSKEFFVSKDYSIFKEPLNWDVPIFFSPQNKTGLVLIDPEQKIVVELRSREFIGSGPEQLYYVTLTINNYDNYMNYLNESEEEKKAKQDKTGF
jgi:hypothetical protein